MQILDWETMTVLDLDPDQAAPDTDDLDVTETTDPDELANDVEFEEDEGCEEDDEDDEYDEEDYEDNEEDDEEDI